MKQIPIRLGPLALLLTVITICLTTLAVLTFTTARADARLAEKYAQTVRTRYELEAEGQAFMQSLYADAALLSETERDAEGVYWKILEKDGSRLRIGLTAEDGEYRIVAWRQEKEWNQDTDIGNLWSGGM